MKTNSLRRYKARKFVRWTLLSEWVEKVYIPSVNAKKS